MKLYLYKILTLLICSFLVQDLMGDTWTDQNSGTYTLDKNVIISKTITVTKGNTLKISSTGNYTIKVNANISQIFKIEDGGTLILNGSENKRITIDGGATFTGGKPFTVNGNNVTINNQSGFNLEEAILNTNGTLTLNYVTIQNVYGSGNGGGILVDGVHNGEQRTTTLQNCTIKNCYSVHGSAIHVTNRNDNKQGNAEKCKVSIIESLIENCYSKGDDAGGSGGTIRTNGNTVSNIYLTRTTVTNNYTAGRGGVVYWNGKGTNDTKLIFNGCKFDSNIAKGDGGAMMLETTFSFEGDTTIISNNKVLNNGEYSGTGGGMVITSYGGNSMAVPTDNHYIFNYDFTDKLKVVNNIAKDGGGVSFNLGGFQLNSDWNQNNDASRKITITVNFNGAVVTGNQAYNGYGGGIRFHNNTSNATVAENGGGHIGKRTLKINVNLNKGTISNNKASANGAGIYLFNANVDNTYSDGVLNVSSNEALNGNGAGIYVDGGTAIDLEKIRMNSNQAKNGASIYISGSNALQVSLGETTMEGNVSTENGGSVYVQGGKLSINGTSTLSGNQAQNGGAIYLGNGTFTIDGNTTLTGNEASENGGGIYQGGGTFTVNAGKTITVGSDGNANTAGQSGGGIYCAGTFTVNGTANVKYNTAHDGAGISVKNGAVTLAAGEISNNKATQFGGGLYVHNEGNVQSATFQGGTFTKNQAQAGGGICAIGKINLTLASNVNENTAVNGGGIYMADGVNMSFGQGIIKANKAESSTTIDSAKDGTNESVFGVGGGIFMANSTSLKFTETSSLGIYGNAASNAAADIFANGNGTSIVLPNTKGMDLTGFDVPGNELYWVEDYVTGETVNGKIAHRYEDALKDSSLPIVKINFDNNETKTISDYICLDLGYDLVFVTLKAMGLLNEDQAKIDLFYRVKDNSTDVARYTGVLFTGIANKGEVVREIGLPSGDWQFKPSDWFSERYGNVMGVSPSPYIDDFIKVTREGLNKGQTGATEDKTITFTFVPKESDIKYDNIIESHHRVVNYMGTGIK